MKELKVVGGVVKEEILMYYQPNAPKTPHAKVKALTVGKPILGTYEGSFVNKFDKRNHRIKTSKGLIAVVGSAGLDKDMVQVDLGADISVMYKGTKEIKSGMYKGKKAHSYEVKASSFDANRKVEVKAALKVAAPVIDTEVDDNDPF